MQRIRGFPCKIEQERRTAMKFPFFTKKEEKKKEEVVFKKVERQQTFTLRQQERELTDFEDTDIADFLDDMLTGPDEFIVLTAPRAQEGVRYVQACANDGIIEVELGIETDGTRLYAKTCDEEECRRIFFDFYENRFHPDMSEYKPVEF